MKTITIKDLFNLNDSLLEEKISAYLYPYEVLPNIKKIIMEMGNTLGDDYQMIKENVWVHKNSEISDSVEIIGPAIIMENSSIRHNAYLRENVIIGPNCVIGNSCEIKNSILLGNDQIPHFNYVGDSILGHFVHLGAGAIITNLRLDKENIKIQGVDTNLRKIGAFIGDKVEIGANSVICPGTIIMPESMIYPLTVVKKIVENNSIVKNGDIKVERL